MLTFRATVTGGPAFDFAKYYIFHNITGNNR